MTKELSEARADARAAQDRANRAEAALREIVDLVGLWEREDDYCVEIKKLGFFRAIINGHGVNLGGDQ